MIARSPYCTAGLVMLAIAAPLIADEGLCITLREALLCKPARDAPPPDDVRFHLLRSGERWEPMLLGFPARQKRWTQSGRLIDVHQTDDVLTVRAVFSVNMDGWSSGGLAWYTVRLRRAGAQYTGAYEGTYRGQPLRGQAFARGVPMPPAVKDHVPCAPEEHPRLVFRRSDLAEMRRLAASPAGGEILSRLKAILSSGDACEPAELAAGFGLLYALTGDAIYAGRARHCLWTVLRREGRLDARPATVLSAALAYDLCYDAWDTPWRWRMISELRARARGPMPVHSGDGVWADPWSHWCGASRGAAGVAALAVLNDPGDPSAEPAPAEPLAVAPPSGFAPGRGVPVCELAGGAMPVRWIFAGPFSAADDDMFAPADQHHSRHVLDALGGCENARPELGTRVIVGDTVFAFQRLPPEAIVQNTHLGQFALDARPLGGESGGTVYLYTVLYNNAARTVRAHTTAKSGVRMWLAGHRAGAGDLLQLSAGHYPLLVEVVVPPGKSSSSVLFCPRFEELSPAELAEYLEQLRTSRLNKSEMPWRNVLLAELLVPQYLAAAFGSAGACVEGPAAGAYALAEGVFPFALAYRNVIGRDVLAVVSAGDALLRPWITGLVAASVSSAPDSAGRTVAAAVPRYGLPQPAAEWERLLARGLLSAAQRDVGPALWTLNRFRGPGEPCAAGVMRPQDAIYALAALRRDAKPLNPSVSLPRILVDETTGLHMFRSGWKDDADVLAAIHLRSTPIRAAGILPEAGSFRISAFGCEFASAASGDDRSAQNVVIAQTADAHGAARRIHFQAWDDGSASLALDMDAIYGGGGRRDQPANLRAMAVDYSGASGVPALLCMVDVMAAPGQKVWQMHTAGRASADRNTFTITSPAGATLTGRFVVPADAAVEIAGQAQNIIRARGSDAFMVVMTIQSGRPPQMRVAGEGLASVITSGAQTLTFDGRRIIMRRP